MLRSFGFNETFIDIIWRLLSNNWLFIIINGKPPGFFHSSRELKQGDPISPSLFIIIAEVLSRGLNPLVENKKISPFSHPPGSSLISHLCFTDDVIIFLNGRKIILQNLMKFLEKYESSSGQSLNREKSSFTVADGISLAKKNEISEVLGLKCKKFPLVYLGGPLSASSNKALYYTDLIDKIQSKFFRWKIRYLSPADRLVLI